MRRFLFLLILLILPAITHAQVSTTYFATIPTISPTTTLSAGHLCATDGRDIYCDGTLPATAGLAINDRIISGTQAMIINSATGVVSLTTASTTWGYLAPSGFSYLPLLNTLGVSSTGVVSATGGYFGGKVGITSAAAGNALIVTGSIVANAFGDTQGAALTANATSGGNPYAADFKSSGATALRIFESNGNNYRIAISGGALSWQAISNGGSPIVFQLPSGGANNRAYFFTGLQTQSWSAGQVASIIQGKTAQTADLEEWQDASSTVLGAMDKAGRLAVGGGNPSATLHVSGTELVTSNSNVLGEVSASTLKVAVAAGAPDPTKCIGGSDYGRIVQGNDNRLYLCVPR